MPFQFSSTPIDGLMIIQPRVFSDDRGFFLESYKQSDFTSHGIHEEFVQENLSRSVRNTIRGLHYQLQPHGQGKLVQVVRGTAWDVAVDLRKDSPTYGQWYGIELSEEDQTLFWLPAGFAHGFAALSETVDFLYKVTSEYCREAERAVRWNDPEIGIQWPVDQPLLSEKDAQNPLLYELPEDERLL